MTSTGNVRTQQGREVAMSTKFQAALQHLQSDAPLSTPILLGLGVPLYFDEAAFRTVWFALPVERRRQATTALLDLAEVDSTTDFPLACPA